MLDILPIIPGKKKLTLSGWYSFNAPCCHHRGHSIDKRSRGGVICSNDGWSYHCFNCNFKAGFKLGQTLTANTKLLLSWCGLDQERINQLSFESFSARSAISARKQLSEQFIPTFATKKLSDSVVPLDTRNSAHHEYVEYIRGRGLSPSDYEYMIDLDSPRKAIVIPCFYNGRIVGTTRRFLDDRKPKYLSDMQAGYVFNVDKQKASWSHLILVEGHFDAISIDACAYMSSAITNKQASLLSTIQKTKIVVPDRDASGMKICDQALQLGYKVSIPDWHSTVKDVNDAVQRYGKLATLISILTAATGSKIKIEMARKKFT